MDLHHSFFNFSYCDNVTFPGIPELILCKTNGQNLLLIQSLSSYIYQSQILAPKEQSMKRKRRLNLLKLGFKKFGISFSFEKIIKIEFLISFFIFFKKYTSCNLPLNFNSTCIIDPYKTTFNNTCTTNKRFSRDCKNSQQSHISPLNTRLPNGPKSS